MASNLILPYKKISSKAETVFLIDFSYKLSWCYNIYACLSVNKFCYNFQQIKATKTVISLSVSLNQKLVWFYCCENQPFCDICLNPNLQATLF